MIVRAAHLWIALFLLTVPSADALYAQADTSLKRALLLEEYGRVLIPESPQISPNGKQLAFVNEERIHVVAAHAEEPHWSSDGSYLYFLSDRTDSSQIWMLPVDDYGDAIQLTDFEPGISSINFSPDESRLLLALSDNELKRDAVETPTIFLGGHIDWNVPILNAELFYQALKVQGINSELIVYPEAHHGGWPEEFEKDYIRRTVDRFDKYLASE